MKNKNFLAIITARGGSKGLKDKNLKTINNKPLIAFPIKAALKSKYIDTVIVSTDSKKIASKAKQYGAEIPFIRPANISKDTTPSADVILHALNFYSKKNINFKNFILLEPTSPFTDTNDIDSAILKLINNPKAESVVGVARVDGSHPNFCSHISKNGFLKPLENKFKSIRRQNISKLFFFDGSLYISRVKKYMLLKTFYHDKTLPYEFPKWKSLEVDDLFDLLIMRSIYRNKKYFL